MKRFKNILYVIETASALPKITTKVQSLARRNKARVHIAVLQESMPSHFLGSSHFLEKMEELKIHFKKENQEFLNTTMADESWSGLTISGSIITGIDFIEIVKRVLKDEHDLVMIEEPNLTRIKIHQLAMKLVRKCPCPVWIIRSKPDVKINNILATINIGEDVNLTKLNSKIVQMATSLARREQGNVHFLHVYNLEFESQLTGSRFKVPENEIIALKKELLSYRHTQIKELLINSENQVNDEQIMLVEGDPVEEIQQTIEDLSIDTLVMGSLSQSDTPGFLIGEHAEQILCEIKCSVLAVKPDGFISPVTL